MRIGSGPYWEKMQDLVDIVRGERLMVMFQEDKARRTLIRFASDKGVAVLVGTNIDILADREDQT